LHCLGLVDLAARRDEALNSQRRTHSSRDHVAVGQREVDDGERTSVISVPQLDDIREVEHLPRRQGPQAAIQQAIVLFARHQHRNSDRCHESGLAVVLLVHRVVDQVEADHGVLRAVDQHRTATQALNHDLAFRQGLELTDAKTECVFHTAHVIRTHAMRPDPVVFAGLDAAPDVDIILVIAHLVAGVTAGTVARATVPLHTELVVDRELVGLGDVARTLVRAVAVVAVLRVPTGPAEAVAELAFLGPTVTVVPTFQFAPTIFAQERTVRAVSAIATLRVLVIYDWLALYLLLRDEHAGQPTVAGEDPLVKFSAPSANALGEIDGSADVARLRPFANARSCVLDAEAVFGAEVSNPAVSVLTAVEIVVRLAGLLRAEELTAGPAEAGTAVVVRVALGRDLVAGILHRHRRGAFLPPTRGHDQNQHDQRHHSEALHDFPPGQWRETRQVKEQLQY